MTLICQTAGCDATAVYVVTWRTHIMKACAFWYQCERCMGTMTLKEAFQLGYDDRISTYPQEFTSGRTWTPEDGPNFAELNEAYDEGVNAADFDKRAGYA